MANLYGPRIVTDGLVLHLDAGNRKSYPGSGTTWYDLSGNGNNGSIGTNLSFSSNVFNLVNGAAGQGVNFSGSVSSSTSCTLVFWIKTTDTQSSFWGRDPSTNGGSYYVGAYSSVNKEYYYNTGATRYYQDLIEPNNIYDNLLDGEWHMVEFKDMNFSTWDGKHAFSSYNTYAFSSGQCSMISMYSKSLSSTESLQNYNALKGRFGL
jgi:hypothetical protein